MKKILVVLAVMYFWVSFVPWIGIKAKQENLQVSEKGSSGEVVDENKNLDFEFKNFCKAQDEIYQSSLKKYDTLVKTVDNYIQRYVSLFLITSDLLDHKVNDVNEEITIDLEISISGGDLAYLQWFSKSINNSDYLKNFSKLDAIFSKIARKKKRSYMENAKKSSKFLFTYLFNALNSYSYNNLFMFLSVLLATWIIQQYFHYKFFLIFIGILVNYIILLEGLKLYWKKIKEADIEIYVKTIQLKGMTDCDPSNTKWYESILNIFTENKCLQYYKNLHKIPEDEVSLFKCIIDKYSFYLIQIPFRILGTSVKDLTGEISVSWPWPIQLFAVVPMSFFFVCVIAFFILILCGKRLRLSFIGAVVELGDAPSVPEIKKRNITNNEAPKVFRASRKLKPWTKSKYPRRSETDLIKRRRLSLKTSKLVPANLDQSALEFNEERNFLEGFTSNESVGGTEPKNE